MEFGHLTFDRQKYKHVKNQTSYFQLLSIVPKWNSSVW